MLNFLLDITPDKSQLLITIKLAGILREKKQEVYYTYTSNPAFTPVLYNKGIMRTLSRWFPLVKARPNASRLSACSTCLPLSAASHWLYFHSHAVAEPKKHTGQRYFCTLSATHSLPVIWFRTTCGIVGKEIAGYKKRQRKKYYCRIIGKRK